MQFKTVFVWYYIIIASYIESRVAWWWPKDGPMTTHVYYNRLTGISRNKTPARVNIKSDHSLPCRTRHGGIQVAIILCCRCWSLTWLARPQEMIPFLLNYPRIPMHHHSGQLPWEIPSIIFSSLRKTGTGRVGVIPRTRSWQAGRERRIRVERRNGNNLIWSHETQGRREG